tara:strand:- start:1159 stop:1506 length:348 start_codon:yes stop_codon:yes gene_type:complete
MNKNQKLILVVGSVIALGAILYLRKKKKVNPAVKTENLAPVFPLKLNSEGYEVKVLQTYLNTTCKSQLTISGVFDKLTEEVSTKCTGTPNTGLVDEKSYSRMFRDLNNSNLLPKR